MEMILTIAMKVIAVTMMMMTMSIFTAVPPLESVAIAATQGRRDYHVIAARIPVVLSRASGLLFLRSSEDRECFKVFV
jgi:hypothetical protein